MSRRGAIYYYPVLVPLASGSASFQFSSELSSQETLLNDDYNSSPSRNKIFEFDIQGFAQDGGFGEYHYSPEKMLDYLKFWHGCEESAAWYKCMDEYEIR